MSLCPAVLAECTRPYHHPALSIYHPFPPPCLAAIQADKRDASTRQRLIEYYERVGRSREALLLRLKALALQPAPNGDDHFKAARELANVSRIGFGASICAAIVVLLSQHVTKLFGRCFCRFDRSSQ